MAGIIIVTGTPGAGKTTLCQHAAKADPRGLHIVADVFFTFPAHPISPILPEAHAQNGAVIAAVCRAAAAFASRGYEVFVDGIIGPWFLPVVAAELAGTGVAIEYAVLRVAADEAVRRTRNRPEPSDETIVRHMHAAFQNLGGYESHALDTTGSSIEDTLAVFRHRRATGVFAVTLA